MDLRLPRSGDPQQQPTCVGTWSWICACRGLEIRSSSPRVLVHGHGFALAEVWRSAAAAHVCWYMVMDLRLPRSGDPQQQPTSVGTWSWICACRGLEIRSSSPRLLVHGHGFALA